MDLFAPPTDNEIVERKQKRREKLLQETVKFEKVIKAAEPKIQHTIEQLMKNMFR